MDHVSGHILILAVALAAGTAVASDDSTGSVKQLKDMGIEDLLEVKAVSATRHDQRQLDSPRSMSVITGDELRRKNFRTVPEALNELVGVMVQETNYGGGAPILRGMVGNRILILVDGMRLNSGAYRLGPNQYLNTIDIGQVERIEVILGPGSVLYGSDALGGVIHVITKTPHPEESSHAVSGELSTRFSSADRGIISQARMTAGWRTLSATGSFSGKNFGDLQTGRGTGRIAHSGYGEFDGDMRVVYTPSDRQHLTLGLARVRQNDVCRSDVIQSGANLNYCWDPTQRDLAQVSYRIERITKLVDWMEIHGRYETQMERLASVSAASPTVRSDYYDRTNTRGVGLAMGSHIGSRQVLTYGLDADRDVMTSSREDLNQASGPIRPLPGNVPNGSTYDNRALFLQDEVEVLGPLSLNLGGRYTTVAIHGALTDVRTGSVRIDNKLQDLTGSAFLSLHGGEHVRFLVGFSQGFRAPNLNDEGFLGVSGTRFEVPNPALKPEKSRTWEAGMKFSHRKFSGTASYFLSDYRGLIDRTPATFAGLSFLDVNGNGVQDTGELNVYQRDNIGAARIIGGGVEGEWRFTATGVLYGNVSWTRGNDTATRTPLTRMPPVKGIFGNRWRRHSGRWIEAYTILAGAQRRLSPSDRSDPRIRAGGTPGFATANLRGGMPVKGLGTITVGLENLANKSYRWHSSGIDAPGTNVVIGVWRSLP